MATSWIRDPAARSLDELLALSPAAATLRAYRDAVWSDAATDARALELCRLRLGQLLGLDPRTRPRAPRAVEAGVDDALVAELSRWNDAARFDARDRAALAFAEQWFLDPSGMTDDACAALRAALGDPGCAAFTMGLALAEALLRLELTLAASPASEG